MVNAERLVNANMLEQELNWVSDMIHTRLKLYFGQECDYKSVSEIVPPDLSRSISPYAEFIRHNQFNVEERFILALSMVPHIRPQLLDVFWTKNTEIDRGFTEFGGWKGQTHSGFIPTGETAVFIMCGDDLQARLNVMLYFDGDHKFNTQQILRLGAIGFDEPRLSGALHIQADLLHKIISGVVRKPSYGADFPARLIETSLSWDDLVLPSSSLDQLDEIKAWVNHGKTLLYEWKLIHKIRPGFVSLFYGPPGTGKTLSACIIGKHCGCDVYKIDLSLMVSKYIGETEKNLSRIFDQAENKNWILFFDEADALFGKRTKVEDAHDRYANQEVSYLLQRIEEFKGVIILASNLRNNMDDAFLRRFQSVIYFPMPKPAERFRIWQGAFSASSKLDDAVDLWRIAEKYELSGGTIMNIVRYSSLKALSRKENIIRVEDIEDGVRKEYQKEGRTV
jgi:hypothetical protein